MKLLDKFKSHFQTQQEDIPSFSNNDIIRIHFIFSGTVQNVGFRIEVWRLAQKLDLTGWVKNNYDGSVECELQGDKEKIQYLVTSMKKIPRIHIDKIKQEQIPLKTEVGFEMMGY